MRRLGAQDDESGVPLIGDLRTGRRTGVHAGKSPPTALLIAHPAFDLVEDGVAVELRRPVSGQPRHAGMRVIPGALAIGVEIGGLARQAPQRITERGHTLAWLGTAEFDAAIVDTPVGGAQRWGRADIHRPRHAPTGRVAAQVRVVAVQRERQRMRPVDVALQTGTQESSR